MLRPHSLAGLCLLLVGCQGPIKVAAHVSATMPPVQDGGPVKGKSLPHDPTPSETPKIAVVDVDGLLVNADFTGIGTRGPATPGLLSPGLRNTDFRSPNILSFPSLPDALISDALVTVRWRIGAGG